MPHSRGILTVNPSTGDRFRHGEIREDVKVCGPDQKARIGTFEYVLGEMICANFDTPRAHTPWFPGIHFHVNFEDLFSRP